MPGTLVEIRANETWTVPTTAALIDVTIKGKAGKGSDSSESNGGGGGGAGGKIEIGNYAVQPGWQFACLFGDDRVTFNRGDAWANAYNGSDAYGPSGAPGGTTSVAGFGTGTGTNGLAGGNATPTVGGNGGGSTGNAGTQTNAPGQGGEAIGGGGQAANGPPHPATGGGALGGPGVIRIYWRTVNTQ